MKKFISLLMIISLRISLVACSNSLNSDDNQSSASSSETEDDNRGGDATTGEHNVNNTNQPELEDSGYSVVQDGDTIYIYYAIEYTNPNSGLAIGVPC
ncbi:MAG: hypothetical protein LUG95_09190 [Clostridiales bacterium]|nr:hypothetical protein [Clostridiales bacterium]